MENGHAAVRQLRYLPAVGSAHGVEVLDFAALRRMGGAPHEDAVGILNLSKTYESVPPAAKKLHLGEKVN
ncbi:hypothetical protein ACTAF0_08925 [Streptomyces murinus]|uniref:hypothetical protein n=1 Tax=Streptomyces murinus TaxID=33900 RepID=UPI003F47E496